jgi:hypothetical protein
MEPGGCCCLAGLVLSAVQCEDGLSAGRQVLAVSSALGCNVGHDVC